mmetsp:Transcript_17429/g.29631  ORF Transcript_17429/g.29631 Transcript_17429/m.29631 type:complete len:233 (+) Transcript_17429:415-1113(+)
MSPSKIAWLKRDERYLPCCAATCAVGGKGCRLASIRSSKPLNSSMSKTRLESSSASAKSFSTSGAPFFLVRSEARCDTSALALFHACLSRSKASPKTLAMALTRGFESSSTTADRYCPYSSSCGNSSEAPWKRSLSSVKVRSPELSKSAALKSCSAYGRVRSWRTLAASPRANTEPPLPRTCNQSSVMMPLAGVFRIAIFPSDTPSFSSSKADFTWAVSSFCLIPAAQTMQP